LSFSDATAIQLDLWFIVGERKYVPGGKAIDFGLLMQGTFAFQQCWFGLAWIGSDSMGLHPQANACHAMGTTYFSASSSWAAGASL